ncbi:hypothetical protein [Erythrobacter aurantius]|uniref:hypothetical protein n=1 Tax=Erythrobacter aurantius TaxID=2909249 RepID=UPI0020799B96|nr:hypothetical protein [Erythrobacter aurantius]
MSMQILVLPFILLNLFAGLLGGAGMLFQGEWSIFFLGLAWMFVGAYVLSLALLPGMIFAPIAAWAADRDNLVLVAIAAIPAMAWTYTIVAVSCVAIFSGIVHNSDAGIFHLLWGYASATGPWSFLAREDAKAGNDYAALTSFFAQLGVISMMIATLIEPRDTDFYRLIYWFAPLLLIGLVVQLFIVWVETKNSRHGLR